MIVCDLRFRNVSLMAVMGNVCVISGTVRLEESDT